jgi:hypothetical protein
MKKNVSVLTLSQIDWDINLGDVVSRLNALSNEDAAKALGISLDEYRSFDDADSDAFRKFASENIEKLYAFLGLPTEVVVPDKVASTGDSEDIDKWLSEEYLHTFNGYVKDFDITKERALELLGNLLSFENSTRGPLDMAELLKTNGFERNEVLSLGCCDEKTIAMFDELSFSRVER